MWEIIGIAITVIVGPLLAFALKKYWDGKAAEAAAAARQANEEQNARNENKQAGDVTRDVNESIDKQKAARDEWAKNQRP